MWPVYTAVYMLNKNGNSFLNNNIAVCLGFFLKFCRLCFPKPLLQVALMTVVEFPPTCMTRVLHSSCLTLIAFQSSKIAAKAVNTVCLYIHYKSREYFEYIRTVAHGISLVNSKSYLLATVTSKDLQLKSNSMVWTMTAL